MAPPVALEQEVVEENSKNYVSSEVENADHTGKSTDCWNSGEFIPSETTESLSQQDGDVLDADLQLITEAESFVKDRLQQHDPSHDWHHVHRVRLLALMVSRCSSLPNPANHLVVELSALLHDLCDHKYMPNPSAGSKKDDVLSAPVAHTILEPFWSSLPSPARDMLSSEQKLTIERIVDNVSWSKDEKRRLQRAQRRAMGDESDADDEFQKWSDGCPEFWCVADADRLEAIGSIGIMRCAAFSAVKNRPLHIPPANPQNNSVPPAEQAPGYNSSAMAHFHDKLLKIRGDRLRTNIAREEAERRQGMLQSFLTELDLEWIIADQGAQLSLLGRGNSS